MKRKLVSAIVCLITCSMLFGACGKKQDEQVAEDTTTTVNNEVSDPNNIDEIAETDTGLSPWELWYRDLDNSNCLAMKMDVDECELTMENSQVSMLTTRNADGDPVRIKCENVTLSEDGTGLLLNEDSKIYFLDAVPGIKKINVDCDVFGGDAITIFGAFSITGRTSIDNLNQLTTSTGSYIAEYEPKESSCLELPNYIYIDMTGSGEVKISQLDFYYTGNYTNIMSYYLYPDKYLYYIEGDKYDIARERFDPDNGIFDFYINGVIDSPYIDRSNAGLDLHAINNIDIGNLHRADGSIKSKDELLEMGDYMDFTYDGVTFNIDSFVLKQAHAYTCYESIKDAYANCNGQLHAVVLPIVFSDQDWTQEDEAELKAALGRVLEADGTIVEYEGFEGCETASSYFDKASYGKLSIDSTIISPFEFKKEYDDYFTYDFGRERNFDEGLLESFANWLSSNITDFSLYDQDGNGLIDLLIVTNPGDMTGYDTYYRTAMSLAVEYRQYYGPELARFDGGIGVNYLAFCNLGALHLGSIRGVNDYSIGSLVHEISHTFGIMDYYDLEGMVSPIGKLDLQDANIGDWNAFSKYAVGWIKPQIVLPSEIDEKGSIQITIDAFERNGDCIVIPTANSESNNTADTPFCEYMLVDLFTDEGLYSKDAALFGLDGVTAVRIYHVDGRLEERNLSTPGGIEYTIGTYHAANSYNKNNKYALSLIQASGSHGLLESDSDEYDVSSSDFFREGDSFSVGKYDFYFNDGKMNDGSEYPYTITVKSIENGKAVIEISK